LLLLRETINRALLLPGETAATHFGDPTTGLSLQIVQEGGITVPKQ
jgi:hypothetical protein